MSSPCPAKVILHHPLHSYHTSSEHSTSAPHVLCFSSLDGRLPVERWSGKDIWLDGLRLTLPGCTLTIIGNVRGLQSQLCADAALGFFTEFTVKKRCFLANSFFARKKKMHMIIFKNRPQEDTKYLPLSQDCNCVYVVEVY